MPSVRVGGRVVSCFVRSTAVHYRTVTSDRRFFRPVASGWQPHSCRVSASGGSGSWSGCLETMAVRRARRVFATREGGEGASQYTWSAVAIPSPPLSSPTAICPKWTRAGPRVFAAQLAQVCQASLKSTSPMLCQWARPAGRPRDVACRGRPAENCGVLSCVLEEGVVASDRPVVEARDCRVGIT